MDTFLLCGSQLSGWGLLGHISVDVLFQSVQAQISPCTCIHVAGLKVRLTLKYLVKLSLETSQRLIQDGV